ncbi:MAG TPA: hypothetical protein VK815_07155 [Candidatus Acidoferrales bacterium]|jgi:hypothetical protein|nr:hypothetical protein [Candidatus Acidoferrales bacterium]
MKTKIAVVFCCILTLPAFADPVITFDDFPAPTNAVAQLPTGYHGLNWKGLGVLNGAHFTVAPSGYQAGVVSANNVVYPTFGNPFSSFNGAIQGGLFDLNSAYVTSVLYDSLVLETKGYVHGTLAYDITNILSATTPTLIQFNFYGVDEVDFITSGGSGVHAGYPFGFDPGFAMDNVSVNIYLPYPQLVQNGDFETGNFSGWTQSGTTNFNSVVTNAAYVHSGTYGAKAGPTPASGFLFQNNLPTFAGETYQFSYWFENPFAGIPNGYFASWNSATVEDTTNVPALAWTNKVFNVLAYAPRTQILFGLNNNPSFFGLDDVSVTLVPKVQNGGFETGTFANWTQSGSQNNTFISTAPGFVRSGVYGAALGPSGSLGYITHTNSTVPGEQYLLSFWLNRPSGSGGINEFMASWNGQVLFDQTSIPVSGWTNLHFTVIAPTAQSVLTFGVRNDPDYFALDEISLTPIPLVTNGGFETGDFTGWTRSGNLSTTSVSTDTNYISSGYYGLKGGPIGSLGYISQNLNTIPGQTYMVTCWFNNPTGDTPNDFQIAWDNNIMIDLTNWSSSGWFTPKFLVTATKPTTTLQIGFDDQPSYLGIDEITVQPFPAPNIQSVTNKSGILNFTWNSVPGFAYQPQYSTNFITWSNLGAAKFALGTNMPGTNIIGPDPHRFYRIQVPQPGFIF